jgi:RecB family exonuclease
MTLLRLTLTCVHNAAGFVHHSPNRQLVASSFSPFRRHVRVFSSADVATTEESSTNPEDANNNNSNKEDEDEQPLLLYPSHFGEIPYPTALSPSAVMEFKKCPQSFLFQYLYKLKQPTSMALAKGSMCHTALEKLFDFEKEDRTLENLQNLLRATWSQHRLSDTYRFLFEPLEGERDIPAEQLWGRSALQLLANYYEIEDPRTIDRPNPLKREIWLNAHLTVDPTLGATGKASSSNNNNKNYGSPTFYVRGIVDRLDMVRLESRRDVVVRIVDYKTGKSPTLKYSKPVNERIMEEAFYQLKIYALLMREKGAGPEEPKGMDLRLLRLLFLTSEQGHAEYLDFDLGETEEERDVILQEVHEDLSNVWTTIRSLVAKQDPKAFVGCDRSFCYCHRCRERFVPGTLWEPNN